jgi:hypothetical protein
VGWFCGERSETCGEGRECLRIYSNGKRETEVWAALATRSVGLTKNGTGRVSIGESNGNRILSKRCS